MKQLVICIDESGNEAIYVDGKLCRIGCGPVFAIDVANAAHGSAVTIEHRVVDGYVDHWPVRLTDMPDAISE